mmetsp:Transcript_31031/g.61190  ORF Transcript_31031/g.61190 Transcript_31031/m.61190 type:complete len:434 (-) Transcript_31031:89-1390(-)
MAGGACVCVHLNRNEGREDVHVQHAGSVALLCLEVRIPPRRVGSELEVLHRSEVAVLPRADEDVAVGELQHTSALLPAESPLAFVHRPVLRADEDTASVTFVVHPLAFVSVAICVAEDTEAARSVVCPFSLESVSVGVQQLSLSVLLRVHPVSNVFVSPCVRQCALAMDPICLPVPFVLLSVLVREDSVSLLHVVHPLSLVHVSVGEDVCSLSVHLPVVPVTLENATIGIDILAVAVHLPVHPVAFVFLDYASLCADVGDGTFAVSFVVAPLACVHISFRVPVCTLSVHFSIHPLALILVAVRVRELSIAVDAAVLPLSIVSVSRGELCDSLAVDAVVHPLPLIHGAVCVGESPVSLSLSEGKLSLILFVSCVDESSLPVEQTVADLPVISVAGLHFVSLGVQEGACRGESRFSIDRPWKGGHDFDLTECSSR